MGIGKLRQVLTYHVYAGEAKSTDVKINNADVTAADKLAVNGVVHIIDTVLIPPGFVPPAPGPSTKATIVDVAKSTSDLSVLVMALESAKLTDTLTGKGPFTIFAPSNDAFAKLDQWTYEQLFQPEYIGKLRQLLTYRVYAGEAKSTDLKN